MNENKSNLDVRNALVGKSLYIDDGDDSPHVATIADIEEFGGDGNVSMHVKGQDGDDDTHYCGWGSHPVARLAHGNSGIFFRIFNDCVVVGSTDAAALPRLWESKQGATLHALLRAHNRAWRDCLAVLTHLRCVHRQPLDLVEEYAAVLREYIADIAQELDMLPKKEQEEQDKQ